MGSEHRPEGHDDNRKVPITVDNKTVTVKPGDYNVRDFKALVGISADRVLELVKDGSFVRLADEASVTIVKGLVFVSHVESGGAS